MKSRIGGDSSVKRAICTPPALSCWSLNAQVKANLESLRRVAGGFASYGKDKPRWLTSLAGTYYPTYLNDAVELYSPVFERFGQLVLKAKDSEQLFRLICDEPGPGRVQLARVFRRYVAPNIPVEQLKRKSDLEMICTEYGPSFRPLPQVAKAFAGRPEKDEALAALLWEYHDRGSKGYVLAGSFFEWFEANHGKHYTIEGPRGAGRDLPVQTLFPDYEGKRPIDFIIRRKKDGLPVAVGLARYDGDRGGAQEDDRTGGYATAIDDVTKLSKSSGLPLKILLVNDGPGLALGSMWEDYATLEARAPGVMVCTLKMLDERLTKKWLES